MLQHRALYRFLLLLLLITTTSGYIVQQATNKNAITTATNYTNQLDQLCSRTHTNTAFVGVQPYARLLLLTPGDCFRNCIESYPQCVAVVYYNLHEGDLHNVCYTFDRNSIDENVALVAEKPANPEDVIRALEIVPNCHLFDPVPPLYNDYIKSTDTVSERKRIETVSSSTSTVNGQGRWSSWTRCSGRTPHQIRSQPCEYGRLINRRRCYYGSMYPSYHTAVIIHANIPYPPMPYIHPECHTEEYDHILTQHVDQMRQICCVRKDTNTRESVQKPTTTLIPNCRQICVPQEQTELDLNTDVYNSQQETTEVGESHKSEWGEWSVWSVCSATCDHGTEMRHRKCSGDQCTDASYQVKACENLPPCKTWSEWSQWSDCSVSCDYGERTRSRYCYLGKNRCSGSDFEVESCNEKPCAVWATWGPWSPCDLPCGRAEKTRHRQCIGIGCIGSSIDKQDCELKPCSSWNEWSQWSFCSASCGVGVKQRRRICLGGTDCEGYDVDEMRCDEKPCPEWLMWSAWSSCSVSCGYGYRTRKRTCATGTMECSGENTDIEMCHLSDCAKWSEWEEWGSCWKESNEEIRRRVCLGPEPTSCGPELPFEERTCQLPENDVWSEWSDWSQCPLCGPGTSHRSRSCLSSWCNGYDHEERACDTQPCSEWGKWSEWGPCGASCGNGKRSRNRICLSGYDCPGLAEELQHCTSDQPCAEWQQWGEWSDCDSVCGLGRRTRERQCLGSGYQTNQCYGAAIESAECIDRPCCEWSQWASWTPCDRACGIGKETRARQCQRPGDINSHCECPGHAKESRDCNIMACPTPSITTSTFNQTKKKIELIFGKGTQAPSLPTPSPQRTIACVPYGPCYPSSSNNQTACEWTDWCDWSPCPTTCNFGMTRRHRYCVGDNRCVCNGASLQKVNCAASEQCRKKK